MHMPKAKFNTRNSTKGAVHGFPRQMEHFLTDMYIRVEHQKRNQPTIEKWPFGFVFGVQLGLRQTQALMKTNKKIVMKNKRSSFSL